MRASAFFISTLKETPAEAKLISHQLMLRAGLVKRLASGLYSWLPLGLRVLRKVESIVRKEMDKSGAIELLMPTVQPAELWQESGRWALYGPELLRFKDRHNRDFCIGPTHEEVVIDLFRQEFNNRKQLPLTLYQIQTKFRDEIRPRFGIMRAREFIMKDAYSFHENEASLKETYQILYDTYHRIFTAMGLRFRAVAADMGSIGGTASHEFQVLADSGEDIIVYCPHSDYAANIELAETKPTGQLRAKASEPMHTISTPDIKTIDKLSHFLHCDKQKIVKSIVVDGIEKPILLLLRGDNELNEIKASKLPDVKTPLAFSAHSDIQALFGASPGSIGPVGFSGKIYADYNVMGMSDMVTGANKDDHHLTGVNFGRDCQEPIFVDLRQAEEGDPSPCGKGTLQLAHGIEVGHIFQLGTQYSDAMHATFFDDKNTAKSLVMGCYGIGITRVVAAAIEQNHDERGIVFHESLAPFVVTIVPLGYHQDSAIKKASDDLYHNLSNARVDVLLDDRDERAGVLLANSELIGIPHRIVIGKRNLNQQQVEYQPRQATTPTLINYDEVVPFILNRLSAYQAYLSSWPFMSHF